ncbi:MAG: cobalt transporter CbiM [Chloroflexota bacterium]
MHIPDGLIPATVAAGGYVIAGALTYYSVRKINQAENAQEQIPKVALMTAAFFITSLIHIPIPPTSIHPLLSGLVGALLGWFAMPSILIGLLLQAMIFGHGGLTTLGVNAVILGVPAIIAHFAFQGTKRALSNNKRGLSISGFVAGAVGVGLSVLLFFGFIFLTIPADIIDPAAERQATWLLTLAHSPLILVEGFLTAALVGYLNRVKPELLGGLSEARA